MVKEWYLLLKRYIEAKNILMTLDSYREEQRELIMSGHFPSYHEDVDTFTRVSAENTAIDLVALDNRLEKTYKRCIKRIETLNKALDTLSYEEQAAFERLAWGIDSHVPKYYEKQAITKVYEFINDWTSKEEENWLKEQRLNKAMKVKAIRESIIS